jgi:hypothetical protein
MRSKMPVSVVLVVMDLASIEVVFGSDGSLDSRTDAKLAPQASYRKLVENYTAWVWSYQCEVPLEERRE